MLSFSKAKRKAIAASDFCADQYQRLAEPVESLEVNKTFYIAEGFEFEALKSACLLAEDEGAFRAAIRRWRNLHMLRIAVSDIADIASTQVILKALSALADCAVTLALDWEHKRLQLKHGEPLSAAGKPQRLYALGMGKLGGYELNFSSDIDLIFLYPEPGSTDGQRVASNQEFFTKLAQKVSGHLSAITADGFVFRVDTRLRPFGDSGPLVMHSQQALEYYEQHGREWERYAMIKARACAGDLPAGKRFLEALQPFVYRRYIDFTAVHGLRQMKRMIETQYTAKNLQQNIKLGPGGIREIEFIAQLFQLMRGGRIKALRGTQLRTVLKSLGRLELLEDAQVVALTADYDLLRRFENRLQQYRDQQTHQLPDDNDGAVWQRLALSLSYTDQRECQAALVAARARVHQIFSQLFADEQDAAEQHSVEEILDSGDDSLASFGQRLNELGYDDEALARRILSLSDGRVAKGFSDESRGVLLKLLDQLLLECKQKEQPVRALSRVFEVLEGIGQRAAYIALLAEYPDARDQLISLCDASPWITHQLARHPLLLDELLDPRVLEGANTRESLEADLQNRLGELAAADLEEQMEALRQFKNAAVIRVAAADINHNFPLMSVSDRLTELAEIIVNAAVDLANAEMQRRYGKPMYSLNGQLHEAELLVVGYGKLGGLELGYGSDLDIVFLHTSCGEQQLTDGEKQQSNGVYFSRVVQRVMHILQTITPSGRLYEVDIRLRPNGASGMPVTSVDAYAKYLAESAWTWEEQALVRARLVVGSEAGRSSYEQVRHQQLAKSRSAPTLAAEVQDMKTKMAQHLDTAKEGQFNLKYGEGGLVDIEFYVQYLVLLHAVNDAVWVRYSDNVRIIQCAASLSVLPKPVAQTLIDAYVELRRLSHSLALQEQSKELQYRPEAACKVASLLQEYFPASAKD